MKTDVSTRDGADCPVPQRGICRKPNQTCRWLFQGRGSLPRPLIIHLFSFWGNPKIVTVGSNHAAVTWYTPSEHVPHFVPYFLFIRPMRCEASKLAINQKNEATAITSKRQKLSVPTTSSNSCKISTHDTKQSTELSPILKLFNSKDVPEEIALRLLN